MNTIEIQGWTIRYRLPDEAGPHPVVWLLHGFTGDEDSMWVFASRLPSKYLILAPRGLYSTPVGGYSWHANIERTWPRLNDFRSSIDKLNLLMENWPDTAPPADFTRFRMAGFSQGGALSYSYALLFPERIIAIAGLASFLPDGAASLIHSSLLKNIPIFISHGTKDSLVPITRARQAVSLLDQTGAETHYCESDVGHKLSAECFNGMEIFFRENN